MACGRTAGGLLQRLVPSQACALGGVGSGALGSGPFSGATRCPCADAPSTSGAPRAVSACAAGPRAAGEPRRRSAQPWAPPGGQRRGLATAPAGAPPGPGSDTVATQPQQQQVPQPGAQRAAAGEDWTEVVDERTGQTYFWNESTGETTELGEPRPRTRFRDSSFRGSGDARFQDGWREPPDGDRTYTYSFIGSLIGVTAGWATQYFH